MGVFLGFGLCMPCLQLQVDLLTANNGGMALAPLDGHGAAEPLQATVSVTRCLEHSARWAREGEAVCVLVYMLLAIFVVAMTGVDAVAILIMGFLRLRFPEAVAGGQVRLRGLVARPGLNGSLATLRARKREFSDGRWECDLENGSCVEVLPANFEVVAGVGGTSAAMVRVLHRLSMLDVLIAGVAILCMAGRGLRESGLTITLQEGFWVLLLAEACRHAACALAFAAIPSPSTKMVPKATVHSSATGSTSVGPRNHLEEEVEEIGSPSVADGDSDTTYDWDIGQEAVFSVCSAEANVEIRASGTASLCVRPRLVHEVSFDIGNSVDDCEAGH